MKKLLMMLVIGFTIGISARAQDEKTEVKKTTTPVQKVHNTFSRHKKYKGYKTRTETNGVVHKKKVNYKSGKVETSTHN